MKAVLCIAAIILGAGATTPAAEPFKLEGSGHQVTYEYSWPAEATAIPQLDKLLRNQMEEDRGEIVASAESMRGEKFFEMGVGYESQIGWETAGQSNRLLSLSGGHWSFTGGAHGNGTSLALLWDRQLNKTIEIAGLFDRVSEFVLMHPAMCGELNKDRMERREGEKFDTGYDSLDDAFNGCPQYEDLKIWVSDENKNGRFDTINFAADSYVAGPYSEGPYLMDLPISEQLIEAMKPDYRDSFEAGQTQ